MPLINLDIAQLEWRVAAFLAQDKLALKEIEQNYDIHSDNQKRFNLPDRVTAKRFVFKLNNWPAAQ